MLHESSATKENEPELPAGRDVPNDFNVIIEIPMNADPIKYEVDKDTGAIFVDRFMGTAMHYPCNYGYVPQHLSPTTATHATCW
jgi:inorganic pyrophosphatase